VTGQALLEWRDFGIKDPAILMTRLHDTATVRFRMLL